MTEPSISTRYFMSLDDDGHTYIIPVTRRANWEKWVDNANPEKPSPKWAIPIDNIESISFIDWQNVDY